VYAEDGKTVLATIAQGQDITERKKAEEAVRLGLDRYRSYIEATGQLGWTTNGDGEVVEDIPSWRAYTGQSYEEIKGWGWSKVLHPDDLEHTIRIWKKAVATRTLYEVEYRLRRYDGVYRHFMARGLPVLEEDGSIREWVGTCIDITERKKAEEALRQSEERLNRAQEIARLGSWELDLLNNRLSWSDEVYRIFGLKPQEFGATYEAFLEAVHPDDRKAVDAAYSGSVSEGRDSYEIDHRVVRKTTSEIRIVHEKCEHIRDEQGRIVRSLGMVQDVTERKKAEEDIRALNESLRAQTAELAASNKELEAFSYSVSHDLRAPLRNIDGFSQALLEDYAGKFDQKGQNYLKRVRAAAQRMGELIDDLLNLSVMIRKEMRSEEVDLSEQARTIMDELKNTASERKVEMKIQEKMRVSGDPLLLRQLLENLLGNAWKFTSKNSSARIEFGSIQKNGEKTFFIKDDGAGFDMKYVNKMFIPFQRLHSVEEFSGNGIGLAIVRRIVDRHGGKIWAEGEVGKGATFYFTLE
jgi:PAS domain S-box-containing protein